MNNIKTYIISPHVGSLMPINLHKVIDDWQAVCFKHLDAAAQTALLADQSAKILGLDPDSCNWTPDETFLLNIPNLQAVCLSTTSMSWAPVRALRQAGIRVTHVPNFSTQSVAEWSVLMALSLARRVPEVIDHNWQTNFELVGFELYQKTAGIIGLGAIGTQIAHICAGFGMQVQYWSRSTRNKQYQYTSLEEVLHTSDFIFPAVAKTPETKQLVTRKMLEGLKSTAIVSSIASGILDHQKLLRMVKNNSLGGYGFEGSLGSRIDNMNVWAGPSHAWLTNESIRRNFELWFAAIQEVITSC